MDITLWTLSVSDKTVKQFSDVVSKLPDGRPLFAGWQMGRYTSRGSTDAKVYVEPFPTTGVKHELFIAGAAPAPHKVVWSPRGDELFYIPRVREFEVVSVTTRPAFAFGQPCRRLVRSPRAAPTHERRSTCCPTAGSPPSCRPKACRWRNFRRQINVVLELVRGTESASPDRPVVVLTSTSNFGLAPKALEAPPEKGERRDQAGHRLIFAVRDDTPPAIGPIGWRHRPAR